MNHYEFWIIYCAGAALVAICIPLMLLEAISQWTKIFKLGKQFYSFLIFKNEFKNWYDTKKNDI